MNAYSRFTLTLLSTALLLPNDVSCQVPVPPAASSQANYQSEPQQLPDVEANVFYKALKPYGDWVEHKTYGQVWYPRDVPKNWRPYSNGHWARTREYGWLWVANEPWGWAVFHYGRWAWDTWYGWIWIPGHTWAPAWVFWRSGGGYTAWAAMPPNAVWQPNVGMNVQYFDYNRDIHQDSWVAVCNDSITNPDIATKCYPAASNDTIINQTKVIQQSNIVQHNNSIHKQVSVLHNTIANRPPITVSNAPIVPVTISTAIPEDVTATNANTATAIVVQPEIPAPTPEQIAREELLAKTLAEQNTAVAKTTAGSAGIDKQPREAGRLTGASMPEDTVIPPLAPNVSKKPDVIPVLTLQPVTPPNDQSQQQVELQAVLQAAKQIQQQVEQQAAKQAQQQAELQAALQAAKQTQQQVEQQAAEQARQQTELQAALQTAKQAQQQAEQQAAEQTAKQAQQQAEQQATEQVAKLAQQQAEQQAAEQAAKQAQQQAEQQAAEQTAKQAQQQAEQQAAEQAAKQAQQQAEAAKKKAECGAAEQTNCNAEEVKLIRASPRDYTKQDFYSPFINIRGNRVTMNPELTEWRGRKNRKLSHSWFDKHTTND